MSAITLPLYASLCAGALKRVWCWQAMERDFQVSAIAKCRMQSRTSACSSPLVACLQVEYFFRIHDPTTPNRQGNDVGTQYRSAIFYHNDQQKQEAEAKRDELQKTRIRNPIATEIIPAGEWYDAEGRLDTVGATGIQLLLTVGMQSLTT